MNLTKLIFSLKVNLKSSKVKYILYVLIISLFFLIVNIVSSAKFSIEKFNDKYVNSDFEYKLLAVNVNDESKRLEVINTISNLKIPEITKIFKSNMELLTGANIHESTLDINGVIDIYGVYKGINYEVDYGRKIKNKYEIICPSTFSPRGSNSEKIFQIQNIIGNDIDLSYNQYIVQNGKAEVYKGHNEKVKLVGTYDINEQLTSYNTCYISTALFEEIIRNRETMYANESEIVNPNRDLAILLLIDDYNNMAKVQQELLNNNITSVPYYVLDDDLVQMMQTILKYVTIIVTVVSILCIYKFIKNNFIENKQNIALYKLIGYDNKFIRNVFVIQYILLTILSFIFSFLLTILVKYIAVYILNFYPTFKVLSIYLLFNNTIILFLFSIFLLVVIIFLFFIRIKRYSVLFLLNE